MPEDGLEEVMRNLPSTLPSTDSVLARAVEREAPEMEEDGEHDDEWFRREAEEDRVQRRLGRDEG